jgi:hypothetical protein
MNFKNYLPMEEKSPEEISQGSIASQYQVTSAPSFLPSGSLQSVWLSLVQGLGRISTTRLVVPIVCHPDVPLVPCPNKLNDITKVSSMTSSSPAHLIIFVYVTAVTITTATTVSLPRLVVIIVHHLVEPSSPMILSYHCVTHAFFSSCLPDF